MCIVDDRGLTICLDRPATRIIALYGAFNEILADLGLEHTLVARTQADELPESITALPVIGTHMRPNPELILGLGPDLVLQRAGRAQALDPVQTLEKHGIPVAVFELSSFAQLCSAMERIGVLTNTTAQAQARVDSINTALDALASTRPAHAPAVFFEVRSPQLVAAGQGSMLTEIMTLAGARNAVQAPGNLVHINEEEVLRLDPDIYLVQRGPMNPNPVPPAVRPHYATLRCTRTNQVFEVDEQLFSRPGPRSLDAVQQLAELVRAWAKTKETRP